MALKSSQPISVPASRGSPSSPGCSLDLSPPPLDLLPPGSEYDDELVVDTEENTSASVASDRSSWLPFLQFPSPASSGIFSSKQSPPAAAVPGEATALEGSSARSGAENGAIGAHIGDGEEVFHSMERETDANVLEEEEEGGEAARLPSRRLLELLILIVLATGGLLLGRFVAVLLSTLGCLAVTSLRRQRRAKEVQGGRHGGENAEILVVDTSLAKNWMTQNASSPPPKKIITGFVQPTLSQVTSADDASLSVALPGVAAAYTPSKKPPLSSSFHHRPIRQESAPIELQKVMSDTPRPLPLFRNISEPPSPTLVSASLNLFQRRCRRRHSAPLSGMSEMPESPRAVSLMEKLLTEGTFAAGISQSGPLDPTVCSSSGFDEFESDNASPSPSESSSPSFARKAAGNIRRWGSITAAKAQLRRRAAWASSLQRGVGDNSALSNLSQDAPSPSASGAQDDVLAAMSAVEKQRNPVPSMSSSLRSSMKLSKLTTLLKVKHQSKPGVVASSAPKLSAIPVRVVTSSAAGASSGILSSSVAGIYRSQSVPTTPTLYSIKVPASSTAHIVEKLPDGGATSSSGAKEKSSSSRVEGKSVGGTRDWELQMVFVLAVVVVLCSLFLGRLPAIVATSCVGIMVSRISRSKRRSKRKAHLVVVPEPDLTRGPLETVKEEEAVAGGSADEVLVSPLSPIETILMHSHAADHRTQAILAGLLDRSKNSKP